jgi:hypothetical protein
MEKKILSFLAVFFTVVLVSAQPASSVPDVTTYRGAFPPAPTRMWTDNWTNWDPKNTNYPSLTGAVTVSGNISSNTTWTSNNVYKLTGLVYVDTLVTLTIEPGTIIRADTGTGTTNSSLIVKRGGKLIAEGTQCNPIVFTSGRSTVTRDKGDWGGIILLGRAKHNLGSQILIEGLSAADPQNYHGGSDDNDNSGSLKYVRIEYGGFVFSLNNEINGLTMGSIGRGTTIDYVQTSFINDDSFEWFGGTVNCRHLVAYRGLDDDFDTDNGFSGTVQYGLGVRDPDIADNPTVSTSEGFESDNEAGGTNQALLPKTSALFYNITQIGAFRCASNTNGTGVAPSVSGFRRGARIRRNSDLKICNSILMNNRRGLFIDGTLALANTDQDSLRFRNNIIAADFTTNYTVSPSGTGVSLAYEDATTRTRGTNTVYANDSINTCSLLTNAWSFLSPDYRPNPAFANNPATDITKVAVGADLAPGIDIDNAQFTPNPGTGPGFMYEFVVNVFENGGAATGGIITVTIPMPSGWDITVPSTTSGTSDVFGGTPNENSNWNFVVVPNPGGSVTITSKPGTVIPKGGQAVIGLKLTRRTSTSTGTSQSLNVTVSGGGDVVPSNNTFVLILGT